MEVLRQLCSNLVQYYKFDFKMIKYSMKRFKRGLLRLFKKRKYFEDPFYKTENDLIIIKLLLFNCFKAATKLDRKTKNHWDYNFIIENFLQEYKNIIKEYMFNNIDNIIN